MAGKVGSIRSIDVPELDLFEGTKVNMWIYIRTNPYKIVHEVAMPRFCLICAQSRFTDQQWADPERSNDLPKARFICNNLGCYKMFSYLVPDNDGSFYKFVEKYIPESK